MTVYVGGASIDENGTAHGGKAGNQSGKELRKQAWYLHKLGWRVFRAKNEEKARRIADDMRMAIANKCIGYDQYERNTLYKAAAKVNFDCSKVTTPCETDCSALVRVCCAYAGIDLPESFRTINEASNLLKTGQFVEMKGDRYTKQSAYLMEGDILVTVTHAHTVVVLNDGPKAHEDDDEKVPDSDDKDTAGDTVDIAMSILKKGSKGTEVKTLQTLLVGYGYRIGTAGVDGDFGSMTLEAVKEYQRNNHIVIDGVVGKETWTKILKG